MLRTVPAILFLLLASPAVAQAPASDSSTLEIRQSLTIGAGRAMSPSGEGSVPSMQMEKGVYQITGDPNRAYRVRTDTGADEAPPLIQSANAGQISEGGLGRLDAEGRDTILITPAPASDGGGPAPVSLSIDYE